MTRGGGCDVRELKIWETDARGTGHVSRALPFGLEGVGVRGG